MIKRFGAVCSNSQAFHRLIAQLETKAGLQGVLACSKASVLLHSPTGIPECLSIFEELSRCHAGGLPPPAVWPLASADEKKKAAAELKQKEDDDAAARAKANEESLTMELDVLALSAPGGEPGVSAGSSSRAVDTLAEDLKRVSFSDTIKTLLKTLRSRSKVHRAR